MTTDNARWVASPIGTLRYLAITMIRRPKKIASPLFDGFGPLILAAL
jgi:hypothetical protein